MSNLDESIGKLLLDLQKNDPDTFKKLMKLAKEGNPELLKAISTTITKRLMNTIVR